eukprot:scaffold39564_cov50-Attheya_sp.AAC.7
MVPPLFSTSVLATAVTMAAITFSIEVMAVEEQDNFHYGQRLRRKQLITIVKSGDEERQSASQIQRNSELFADEENAWEEQMFYNTRFLYSSTSMSMSMPPNSEDLYAPVTLEVLDAYCRQVHSNDVSAKPGDGEGFDWYCVGEDGETEAILISCVCKTQWDSSYDEALLGGTRDDWACVDWNDARFMVVPVIVIASEYTLDAERISESIEVVTRVMERVQELYEQNMNSGRTFRLALPILRLTDNTSEYFNELSCLSADPIDRPNECKDKTSDASRNDYFYAVRDEAQTTSLGASPRDIAVPVYVYTGPDSQPFWLGAAALFQFSVNPPNIAVCPEDDNSCGLYSAGHELGHTFGLGHSCDLYPPCEITNCCNSIMQIPPDILTAILLEPEQKILNASPYFTRP